MGLLATIHISQILYHKDGALSNDIVSLPVAFSSASSASSAMEQIPDQNMCVVSLTSSRVDVFAFPRSYTIRCETMM
jgi:hypothetical protein